MSTQITAKDMTPEHNSVYGHHYSCYCGCGCGAHMTDYFQNDLATLANNTGWTKVNGRKYYPGHAPGNKKKNSDSVMQ